MPNENQVILPQAVADRLAENLKRIGAALAAGLTAPDQVDSYVGSIQNLVLHTILALRATTGEHLFDAFALRAGAPPEWYVPEGVEPRPVAPTLTLTLDDETNKRVAAAVNAIAKDPRRTLNPEWKEAIAERYPQDARMIVPFFEAVDAYTIAEARWKASILAKASATWPWFYASRVLAARANAVAETQVVIPPSTRPVPPADGSKPLGEIAGEMTGSPEVAQLMAGVGDLRTIDPKRIARTGEITDPVVLCRSCSETAPSSKMQEHGTAKCRRCGSPNVECADVPENALSPRDVVAELDVPAAP